MELANVGAKGLEEHIRLAVDADAKAITRLLRRALLSHIHADWHMPSDWLGTGGFVVLPEVAFSTEQRRSVAARLLPATVRLQACLATTADPPPAAWVRVASVAEVDVPQAVLAALLERVTDYLRATAVTELGWLAIRDWPNPWLPDLGFFRANEIVTYVKEDDWLPGRTAVSNLVIHPVQPGDMVALAQLEAAAFDPLWRYSANTLALARRQALCFDTAVLDGQIVGFQLSSQTYNDGAHLVRLTVHPDFHGQGVGSALLAHALTSYRRYGLHTVSLNTQIDNITSQYLYEKFGFRATDQRFPVWVRPL
jgi:ribosomal-protein-alanine N-acetyltransferase